MSFWSSGVKAPKQNMDIWKLSLALAKKHYNQVYLITDDNGYDVLKNLPFDGFIKILNDVPQFPDLWCLGKIYAYYYACQEGNFLHLDNDVFLWEKLPEALTDSDIFVQSQDFEIYKNGRVCYSYNIEDINNIIKSQLPNDWQDIIDNKKNIMTYNMGIFGGKNKNLIKEYCEYIFNMVNNKDYEKFWNTSIKRPVTTGSNNMPHLIKSCMLEQGNLGIICKKNNLIPSMLINNLCDDQCETYRKYTHLMNAKKNIKVVERLRERVSKEPYDLEPLNCSKQEWNKRGTAISEDFNYKP